MIVDLEITNFRSLKDKVNFSMRADSLKSKRDNTFDPNLDSGQKIPLLKTAVIYGANASGKSNFIKAFHAFIWLIRNSSKFDIDKNSFECYEPFELDIISENAPIDFRITFILEHIKYSYEISYNKNKILHEKLDFSPKGQNANLFERITDVNSEFDTINLGKNLTDKRLPKKLFKNQLFLSKFGVEIPHDQLSSIYKYFSNINIWNAADKFTISDLANEIAKTISQPEHEKLKKRLAKLIKISDTKIENINSKELKREEFKLPKELPEEIVNKFFESNKIRTFSYHKVFDSKKEIGVKEFDFNQKESTGTKVLFSLGGKILQVLETGGIIVFDELDNSLHPKLCKFLVRLFNNKISNPHNAQLIFATHEVTLLDKDVFRKDQIWFSQKNKYGISELYCTNEFEGVRDNTNFELWYRTGKFGGTPNIKEVEFIYE